MMRKTGAIVAGLGLAAVLAVSAGAAKAPPSPAIAAKQKRAQEVLAQVNALDIRFGKVVDSWNGARIDLAASRRALAANRIALRRAQGRSRVANARLAGRLVSIYEAGGVPTLLEVIVGASSLGNLLDRFHAAETLSSYDRSLAEQATRATARLTDARMRLRRAEQKQRAVLDTLDATRKRIGAMLQQRRRLLASIRTEVAAMKKREARRQAELAAAARARLARARAEARAAAAQAAAEKAAAARAAAAKAAAAKAAAAAARATRPRTATAPPTTAARPTPPATTVTAGTTAATITTPVATTASGTTGTSGTAPTDTTTTTTTSTTPAPVAVPATPALGPGHPEAASIALQYLGVPYRWGGASPSTGFDCSGLVMYVYAQLGIPLPHQAAAQYGYGVPVPRDQLLPGDLVFFDDLSHVGIYIGAGEMVHAPQTGDVVSITPLSQYGNARYVGARRLP